MLPALSVHTGCTLRPFPIGSLYSEEDKLWFSLEPERSIVEMRLLRYIYPIKVKSFKLKGFVQSLKFQVSVHNLEP